MKALEALRDRRSCAKLVEPGPSLDELYAMLDVAMRAPDHAALRPWRFILIRGEARVALGRVFSRSAVANGQSLSDAQKDKWLNAPLRAPVLVAVVACIQSHVKVPAQEQRYAAAGATTNLLHAAHALNYGAIWRTGDINYRSDVAQALGLSVTKGRQEELLGFVYIGTPKEQPKSRAAYSLGDYVSEFLGGDVEID